MEHRQSSISFLSDRQALPQSITVRVVKMLRRRVIRVVRQRITKRQLYMTLAIVSIVLFVFNLHWLRDCWYLARPLWDKKTTFHELPHYYDARLSDEQLCSLHNWSRRAAGDEPKVIDATILSVELDLLEIRLKELWPVVDIFVVLEADRTFHGKSKPLILEQNIERFAWAKAKLKNFSYRGLTELNYGDSPFKNEDRLRKAMNKIVAQLAEPGDLILVSDVDEIPRQSTLALFRKCTGFPPVLHLALKTYFYSFEFFYSFDDSWRAMVVVYSLGKFKYDHAKMSEFILADAGWHCTFCFRNLSDFRFKMTSYSHNDRLFGQKYLLENHEIQRRACLGLDVFDMLPEAYSYKELFAKAGRIPKTNSFVDLPLELLLNGGKYAFLLKDHCVRQDFQGLVDWN